MSEMNDAPPKATFPTLEPQGQAALLLVESLIHELVAGSVLTGEAAASIVEVALDTQTVLADDGQSSRAAGEVLASVLRSLQLDVLEPAAPSPP